MAQSAVHQMRCRTQRKRGRRVRKCKREVPVCKRWRTLTDRPDLLASKNRASHWKLRSRLGSKSYRPILNPGNCWVEPKWIWAADFSITPYLLPAHTRDYKAKLVDLGCWNVISWDCTIKVHMGVITPYNGPQTAYVSQYGRLQWSPADFPHRASTEHDANYLRVALLTQPARRWILMFLPLL